MKKRERVGGGRTLVMAMLSSLLLLKRLGSYSTWLILAQGASKGVG